MKKFTLLAAILLACLQTLLAQCPAGYSFISGQTSAPASSYTNAAGAVVNPIPQNTDITSSTSSVIGSTNGNGPTNNQAGHLGTAMLFNLLNGVFDFKAELLTGVLSGSSYVGAWRTGSNGSTSAALPQGIGGVEIQIDTSAAQTVPGGNFIYLQPMDVGNPVTNPTGALAKYTMNFPGTVKNLKFTVGGINGNDMVLFKAYFQGVEVPLTTSLFTFGPGAGGGATATATQQTGANANFVSVTSTNSNGGLDPLVNTTSINLNGITVDQIVMLSGKSDNLPATVTIGIYGIQGCVPDIDGDGIPDNMDLDNDNDGIPDLVECSTTLTSANGLTVLKGTSTALAVGDRLLRANAITYLGKSYDLVFDITAKSAASGLTISLSGSNNLQFGGASIGGSPNPWFAYDAYYVPTGTATASGTLTPSTIKDLKLILGDIDGNGVVYTDVMGISNTPPPSSINLGDTLAYGGFVAGGPGAGYDYIRASTYDGTGNVANATVAAAYAFTASYNTFTKTNIVFGSTAPSTYTSTQTRGQDLRMYTLDPCDTDGDGIPDRLDLDSDGDGCPDAIEGASTTITSANLVNSSLPGGNTGAGYTGTAGPVTQNLGNTVGNTPTTIGIPTIAGTGQAIGSSQNPAVNACLFTISGTVFNDANGLKGTPANTVDGTGTNTGNPLFVNLIDSATGKVIDTATVAANGTYTFTHATSGTFNIQLSTNKGTVGSVPPATALPAGWVNTGENLGTAAGNDGGTGGALPGTTADGTLTHVVVGTSNVTNANFGIEQPPTANTTTASAQINPGGTASALVPPATFGGTDPAPGTVDSIKITAFPTGATSITIGATTYTSATFPAAGVTVAAPGGVPTPAIQVDPTANGATTVVIPYVTIDNAGKQSLVAGSATVPFTPLTVSGTVFNDANGLKNSLVDGTGTNAGGLTAYLVDGSGNVVGSAVVAADGTYTIAGASANTSYTVRISPTAGVANGSPAPAAGPPAGWVTTGEGTAAAGDGTPNSSTAITTGTTNLSGVNFGIEQPPTANTATAPSVANPGGTTSSAVPPATFGGTDPATGTIDSIRITAFPTNATSITINGTTYTATTFATTFPSGASVVAPGGVPAANAIKVDPIDGAVTVSIPYKTVDNAGVLSAAAGAANVPFTTLTVSGTVYSDPNGLTDNTINGTGTNAGSGTLTAYLVDPATGKVVGSSPIAANGTYTIPGANANTPYNLVLSNTSGVAVGAAPPAASNPPGYITVAEGTAAAGDGTPNGTTSVTTGTTNLGGVNFAFEQPPTAGTATAPAVTNPGVGVLQTVPPATFSGTDPDGTVNKIIITAFPSNAQTIQINGVTYTAAQFATAFPNGDTIVAPGGVPSVPIAVSPNVGTAVNAIIPYKTIDNAGILSANTGSATQPFTVPSSGAITGTVFNDANGLKGTPANTVDGTGTNASGTLYVTLVNNAAPGTAVVTVPVNADGTFSFPGQPAGTYSAVLSTTNYAPNATGVTPSVPTGWVNTGENLGSGAGNDGTVNGILPIGTTTGVSTSINNINFGIEQPPTANTTTASPLVNPGGTANATIPASTFGGTDAALGTIDSIRITAFPSNATSITINGTIYTPASFASTFPNGASIPAPGGVPSQLIQVDPVDGAVSVVIPYKTVDNAGVLSTNTGSATQPFITLTVSGTVFNDVNGLKNNLIDGTGTNAGGLTAYLVDATGKIVDSSAVAADGTYSIPGANANTPYTVLVTATCCLAKGSTAPTSAVVPAGWTPTGDGTKGTATATGDGTINLLTPITTGIVPLTGVDFGIEQPPTAGTATAPSVVNPGGTVSFPVPPATFTGTDPGPGVIDSIRITTFPTNATTITIGGTTYTAATFATTFPNGASIAAPGGVPSVPISVDPIDGATTVSIPFKTVDNAGLLSANTGAANVPFTALNVSGTIYDDPTGLTDLSISGTGTNAGGLTAYLVDPVTNKVIGSALVNGNGSYTIPGANANTAYNVVVSTTPGVTNGSAPPASIGTAPPAGYVAIGEGTAPAGDGTVNGVTSVTTGTTDLNGVNFGIDQLPTANTKVAPVVANPGPGVFAPVPPATFGGADPDGVVNSIKITAFPANADSIKINGTTYTAANFPAGGVIVPTTSNGQPPPNAILVAPKPGAVSIPIPYVTIDNAGQQSLAPGLATQPFNAPGGAISGNVFNDINGLKGTPLNTVDGTGTNLTSQLYATLVNSSSAAVQTVPVNPDGTYNFANVPDGSYSVVLNTNPAGSTTPSLPAGWGNTGEQLGPPTAPGSDGTPNGILPGITIAGSNTVTNANFGIEQPPVSQNATLPTATLVPGYTLPLAVNPATFKGTDPSGATGTVDSVTFTALPNNCDFLNINGVKYGPGAGYVPFPPGGITVAANPNGTPNATVGIGPNASAAGQNVLIPYTTTDNAGLVSPVANITQPFALILPISFGTVRADVKDCGVTVAFTTESEQNNDHFEVERSADGANWTKVAAIASKGNTSSTTAYSLLDLKTYDGVNYYRIKQVDKDGKYTYSSIVTAKVSCGKYFLTASPNPFMGSLTVQIGGFKAGAIVDVMAADGRKVIHYEAKQFGNIVILNTGSLAKGTYLIRVMDENKMVSQKVVKE